jgi:hypothetical protein
LLNRASTRYRLTILCDCRCALRPVFQLLFRRFDSSPLTHPIFNKNSNPTVASSAPTAIHVSTVYRLRLARRIISTLTRQAGSLTPRKNPFPITPALERWAATRNLSCLPVDPTLFILSTQPATHWTDISHGFSAPDAASTVHDYSAGLWMRLTTLWIFNNLGPTTTFTTCFVLRFLVRFWVRHLDLDTEIPFIISFALSEAVPSDKHPPALSQPAASPSLSHRVVSAARHRGLDLQLSPASLSQDCDYSEYTAATCLSCPPFLDRQARYLDPQLL